MTIKISDRYLLSVVNHKAPRARRQTDRGRDAMAHDARQHGAQFGNARELGGAYIELYSPGSIKSVMTHFHSFNAYHQAVTCEYIGGRGAPRLLSIHKQAEHADKYHDAVLKWQQAKAEWVAEYAEEREKARLRLGEYFREMDYPSPAAIADYWQFACQYMPIADPSAFEIGQFTEDQRTMLERQLVAATERAANQATKAYRDRLREALTRTAKQLRNGQRLHPSLATELKNLADADLNVTGDSELARMLPKVDAMGNDAAKLIGTPHRERDDKLRSQYAERAEHINLQLGGILKDK